MKIKWKRLVTLLAVLLLLCGFVAGLLNLGAIGAWAKDRIIDILRPPDDEGFPGDEPTGNLVNILCIGVDKGSVAGESGYYRSDVLMLASVDFENRRMALVSIPRDTRVEIEGHGVEKINAAHAISGPRGAADAVEELTGMGIQDYIEVDFDAFRTAVDAMGGVPVHMDYEIRDPLVGCLGAGDITLTGRDALVLVRSRALPNGDLDRIGNQQKFLAAMAGQLAGMDARTLERVYQSVNSYLKTSMEGSELWGFAEALRDIGIDNIQMATIPGSEPEPAPGELWYYIHDPGATARLMENIRSYCSVQAPPEDQVEQVVLEDPAGLALAVLNGTGTDGLANQAAQDLKAEGYRPVTGNTLNPYDRTVVYVSSGYSDLARQVAGVFWEGHDPPIQVDEEVAAAHQARVVVVLGRDYP